MFICEPVNLFELSDTNNVRDLNEVKNHKFYRLIPTVFPKQKIHWENFCGKKMNGKELIVEKKVTFSTKIIGTLRYGNKVLLVFRPRHLWAGEIFCSGRKIL